MPVAGPGAAADERGDAARERFVDLLRADEVDVSVDAAGGEDQPLAGDGLGRHADDHPGGHAGHHVRIAGLADAGDAAVLDPDVRLADAGPVDDQRVGDHAVERPLLADAGRLPHAVPQDLAAAELALVAVGRRVGFDFGDQPGVAEAHPVAGGRAVDVGVVPPVDAWLIARVPPIRRSLAKSKTGATRRGPPRSPGRRKRIAARESRGRRRSRRALTVFVSPGSNRTAVPAGMSSRMPYAARAVEDQRAVGLDEVIVAADLDRPIAAVRRPRGGSRRRIPR